MSGKLAEETKAEVPPFGEWGISHRREVVRKTDTPLSAYGALSPYNVSSPPSHLNINLVWGPARSPLPSSHFVEGSAVVMLGEEVLLCGFLERVRKKLMRLT